MTRPGVSSGAEGASAIFARGGNLGNNLITLDGVRIYGYSHLFGLSSAISSSIISSMDFCLGGFDGDKGGLTASHISINTPSLDSIFNGETSVSNNFLEATVNAPIIKGKASVMASGRWSPFALEYNILKNTFDKDNRMPAISMNVFDLFAKAGVQITSADEISFSCFSSSDNYAIGLSGADYLLGWQNMTGHLSYKHTSSWITLLADLSYNYFKNNIDHITNINGIEEMLRLQSRIEEETFSIKAKHTLFGGHFTLSEGCQLQSLAMSPGAAKTNNSDYAIIKRADYTEYTTKPLIASAFIEARFQNRFLKVMAAFRKNIYNNRSSDRFKAYQCEDPELSARAEWYLTPKFGIAVTFDERVQYDHTLEGSPLGWPLDLIVPSTRKINPEHARQYYGGFFSSIAGHRFSMGGYWKSMKNLVYCANAESLFTSSAQGWNDIAQVGQGTSYGCETLYEGIIPGADFSWELAYTWSKTDRVFKNINNGLPFPAKFDRRHICNANLRWKNLTATITYQSGHWETISAGQYDGILPYGRIRIDVYDTTNNWRMPEYVRFDLSYKIDFRTTVEGGRKLNHNLTFGVFNLLNKRNPSMLVYDTGANGWYYISLFPIMPSIRYSIKF